MQLIKAHRKTATAALTLLMVISLMLLSGCNKEEEMEVVEEVKQSVTAMEITPGLRRNFSTTGEVTANKTASLTAEFRVNVVSIDAKPGDIVTKGQTLITLSSSSVQERFGAANVTYGTAVDGLQQSKITGQTSVQAAQESLKTAEKNLEKVVAQSNEERRQAEETRNAAGLNLDLSMKNSEAALAANIRNTESTTSSALTFVDSLLEFSIEQRDLDYIYETHIGVRDPIFRQKTVEALGDALVSLQQFDGSYELSLILLEETEIVLEMIERVLETSITSPEYDQVDLDADFATAQGNLSTVRGLISSLKSSKASLDLTEQTVGGTSQTVVNAEAAYNATIARINANEEQATRSVQERRIALEQAKANAFASELQAKSTVNNAAASLRDARVSNEKLVIEAPFDGYVVDIPVRVGDQVDAGGALVSFENDEMLKIVTYLSSSDAATVHPGDIVVLEGIGEARVSNVSPSADPVTKKYKVEILHKDEKLSPGSFVTISFSATNTNGDTRLFVPVTAVHISAAEVFVWLIEEKDTATIVQKADIKTGDVEGKYVEVLSGINEGDRVVIEGGRMIHENGTAVDITSS